MLRGWRGGGAQVRGALLVAVGLAIAGCSVPQSSWHPVPRLGGHYEETGIASWYGPGFHGNRTSNGEIYDSEEMTAAHQTLPLGTRVRVTNLENDRSLEVRINDRGPFAKGRILDLSHAAARELGIIDDGTARVRVESIDDGGPPGIVGYAVQAGSFLDGDKAHRLTADLATRFSGVYLSQFRAEDTLYYRVRIGPFERRDDALLRAREIASSGLPAVIVEEVRR